MMVQDVVVRSQLYAGLLALQLVSVVLLGHTSIGWGRPRLAGLAELDF